MAARALCVLLFLLPVADAATLSATKLRLPDYKKAAVKEEAAPVVRAEPEPAQAVKSLAHEDKSDNFDSWEDNELEQPGLPSLKPKTPADSAIVKAKVKQVRKMIESHKAEWNNPKTTEERRDAMLMETMELSRKHMPTPAFDYAMCLDLWQNVDAESVRKSFYDCPALRFPDESDMGIAKIDEVQQSQPSAFRSALLSNYLWKAMLKNEISNVKEMLAEDATMTQDGQVIAEGKDQVARKAPQIGWPRDADLGGPEDWLCDAAGCVLPLTGWSEKTCNVMAKFNAAGKCSFIYPNLSCWR